jgi:hypothetical protein
MVEAGAAVCGGYTTMLPNAPSPVHFAPMLGGLGTRRLLGYGTKARAPMESTSAIAVLADG